MKRKQEPGATLVLLVTYNEISNIGRLFDSILSFAVPCDVLVIDDNSPDGTGHYVTQRAAADRRITLISRRGKLGIGSAHRLGWLYARRHGYARIVSLDADLSHDPCDIPRLLATLDAGADVALGSRFIRGGKLDYNGWRLFLSRTANAAARWLVALPIADYTNSFRAARLDRVPFGLIELLPRSGYSFFLTATVQMARHGLHIEEVPIHFHVRDSGRSKMPRLEIMYAFYNLIYLFFHRRPILNAATADRSQDCRHCGHHHVIAVGPREAFCLVCMKAPT